MQKSDGDGGGGGGTSQSAHCPARWTGGHSKAFFQSKLISTCPWILSVYCLSVYCVCSLCIVCVVCVFLGLAFNSQSLGEVPEEVHIESQRALVFPGCTLTSPWQAGTMDAGFLLLTWLRFKSNVCGLDASYPPKGFC